MNWTVIISIVPSVLAIYFFYKNRDLAKQVFKYQKQKDLEEIAKQEKETKFSTVQIEKESQEYYEYIRTQYQDLNFTGLNALLQRPIKLENIYVKLKTIKTASINDYNTSNDLEESETTENVEGESLTDSLKHFFENRYKIQDPVRILIVGHPGSGKTTLMKWIALQCLKLENTLFYSYIPIFIPLKDFGKNPDNTFRKYSIQRITYKILESNNVSTTFLKESFSKRKVLFLLDGLDEIADESLRREIIDWIQNQNILRSLLIVTSRFSGIQVTKGITFNSSVGVYEIQNFTIEDVKVFLRNWYKNVELAVDPGNPNQPIKKAEENSEDLIRVITDPNHKSLRSLAINPLLLTIIAIVHRTRAVLPRERHKLYEEAVKVMIELWNLANRKINLNFTIENSISNLSIIAVYLMKNNTRELGESEVKSILPATIEGKSLDSFLHEMILKSGLLYESEGKYGFLHLTFQEYLTARFFQKAADQNSIIEHIYKGFWIETFKLFVNIGNTHLFFKEMINRINRGTYDDVNFLLELAQEIVIEGDRIKYVGQVLNLLAPQLLSFKNTREDSDQLFKVFSPSISLYLSYTDKVGEIFWDVLKKAENKLARNIAVIVLFSLEKSTRIGVASYLKNEVENIEMRFKSFDQEFKQIEIEKKRLLVNEERQKVREKIIDEEFDSINLLFILFNIFAIHTKNYEDLLFLFKCLKSNVSIIKYLAILSIRDYPELKEIVEELNIDSLAMIKPFQDIGTLENIPVDEIRKYANLASPQHWDVNFNEKFYYWNELRPLWQIEQLQSVYNSDKKSLLKNKKSIEKAADNLINKLAISYIENNYFFTD